ncbi:MAG: RraA family protein [Acidobacteriota bacterium]
MALPPDAELFPSIRSGLYTAVVGDVLDRMGHLTHFLPPRIRPIDPSMVVVGRAMPVVAEQARGTLEDPFGKLLEALDALREDEVWIADGGSAPFALWGELMSTRARHLKAAGAVMNGHHRDTAGILSLGFPTFSWGGYSLDFAFRARVIDWRVPVEIEGVPVRPGDLIFGDRDGVLVVARELEEEALTKAFEKVRAENQVREGFRKGMPAVEAFARYGAM